MRIHTPGRQVPTFFLFIPILSKSFYFFLFFLQNSYFNIHVEYEYATQVEVGPVTVSEPRFRPYLGGVIMMKKGYRF